jgi:hypothetical protein
MVDEQWEREKVRGSERMWRREWGRVMVRGWVRE